MNTGELAETDPALHKDISTSLNYDIYRLSVAVEGDGWNAQLLNSLVSMRQRDSEKILVFISHEKVHSNSAMVTLTARSENDREKTTSSAFIIKAGQNNR
jgi:hypothetical protein